MVDKAAFRKAATLAVSNIIRHGDTDIFPLPFEAHAFFDNKDSVIDLVCEYDDNFDDYLTRYPPSNTNALTPVSYFGFRWGTQIDPIWNAHFLACVIALSDRIERVRVASSAETVFSYRYAPDTDGGDLFDRTYGWQRFMRESLRQAREHAYVTVCDISEFYPRLGHHRLDNALLQIAGETPYAKRIMAFLSNFSNTRSFGLPIGGPAARLLSELTINQIDQLLVGARVPYTRFADDFHLFAASREEAYQQTIFLSEKLFANQGLSLQKSKTRIMTAAEFQATSPMRGTDDGDGDDGSGGTASHADDPQNRSRRLLNFSLRFDPYSPTAEEDYEALKDEIRRFDVLGLLKEELAKSRIHIALSRKIIAAIRHLDGTTRDDAVLSVVENADILYPIFGSALVMMDKVYGALSVTAQKQLRDRIVELIRSESHVFRIDVHLCFAIRVLQNSHDAEVQQLLKDLFAARQTDIVRRDIILVLARWGDWYWLSDISHRYRQLSDAEKRALIVASYALSDEGKHWRGHIKREMSPFELFVKKWASERKNAGRLGFPL